MCRKSRSTLPTPKFSQPTRFTTISLIAATYWFAYFLVILPLLGVLEKPLPMPATIEEDFKAHYPGAAE